MHRHLISFLEARIAQVERVVDLVFAHDDDPIRAEASVDVRRTLPRHRDRFGRKVPRA